MGKRRDRLAARPVYRNRVSFPKLRDASDMIIMMMGGKDRDQLQLLGHEIVEHRPGLTGVDYRRAARVAQGPDVVVPESAQGEDFEFAPRHIPARRRKPARIRWTPLCRTSLNTQ